MSGYSPSPATVDEMQLVESHAAHNYAPLPVVVASGQGAWVTDIDGKRYLDFLSAYSAVNFGHSNPIFVKAAIDQLQELAITSRAVYSTAVGSFLKSLTELCQKDMALPMNTGVEAVETSLKIARKWGYQVKGVPEDQAKIITMQRNFHGRTISVVSFSSDEGARQDFGPFTPGFVQVPFGDAAALEAAIDDKTIAVLVEPIQGEAGVITPPDGYIRQVREITQAHQILMIADEIQTGLGRCGATFACELYGVVPDLYLLGKALGGAILPVSAVVGNSDVLGLLKPGQHGSTFGGNPLACAVGKAVVDLLETGEYQARSRELGAHMHARLAQLVGPGVSAVRGVGLWAGIDIDPAVSTGWDVCLDMLAKGVIVKNTHVQTIRLAPALVITKEELNLALDALAEVMRFARPEGVEPTTV